MDKKVNSQKEDEMQFKYSILSVKVVRRQVNNQFLSKEMVDFKMMENRQYHES